MTTKNFNHTPEEHWRQQFMHEYTCTACLQPQIITTNQTLPVVPSFSTHFKYFKKFYM